MKVSLLLGNECVLRSVQLFRFDWEGVLKVVYAV